MAKLSKEDFMSKYEDRLKEIDDVELIEDISDSLDVEDSEELNAIKIDLEQAHVELEQAKADYLAIKEKYKERFFQAVETEEVEDETEEEMKEEEVIDIKEI